MTTTLYILQTIKRYLNKEIDADTLHDIYFFHKQLYFDFNRENAVSPEEAKAIQVIDKVFIAIENYTPSYFNHGKIEDGDLFLEIKNILD